MGGQPRSRLARVNADGSLDATLNPGANDYVSAIAQQPDGKLLVGGAFTQIDGLTRSRIARLNGDGTPEPDFIQSPTTR